MKAWKYLVMVTVIATSANLIGCGKTTNSGDSSPAPAAAPSVCVRQADGTMKDQYGRFCQNYSYNNNQCFNVRYDYSTGRYIDLTTGQAVNCGSQGYYDGYNSVPYYGQYGGSQINGCAGWSQIYQAQYIPVDFGGGALVCMNTAYLQQYNPGYYNWNQYYYSQMPIYACRGYDCNGGGSYYGYQYNCRSSINFGVAVSGFGVNFGYCGY